MFTAPKFRVGEIVFAKDPKFAGPLTTTSFNPKKGRNKKGYVIGVKDKDGNLFSLDEEQLVAVDKAFFLVRCEYVWDCDRTDINAIFTNKYDEAKEVFDEKVKESKDTLTEHGADWITIEDGNDYSTFADGYYAHDHEDIVLQVFEVGDTEC